MTTAKESRAWLVIGVATCAAGGVLLAAAFKINGVISADTNALAMGLTAAFILLAGSAALVTGRVLHAVATGYHSREAVLWRLLAIISAGVGTIMVVRAHLDSQGPWVTLDNLAQGLAGSFAIMVGVICLLGQRVMEHATQGRAEVAKKAAAGD
jgi:hypothetical protein